MADSWLDGYAAPQRSKPRSSSSSRSSSRSSGTKARASRPQTRSSGNNYYSPPSGPPGYSSGPVPTVTPAAPKPESIKEWLAGDDVYQQALRGSKRSLTDFLSEITRRRGEAGTLFNQTTEQMEIDRERQLEALRNEFASRGLIHSGVYANEQGDFQEDFLRQMEQLEQANASLMNDLLSQETNYKREHELALEAARQEALARRAARYGI